MSKNKSGVWSIALPLSIVFLAAVYYVKMPDVRKAVDARTPVVRNLLGRFVQESGVKVITLPAEQDPAFVRAKPPRETAPVRAPEPAPMVTKAPELVVPPAPPESVPAPGIDLQRIAGDRALWPKKVALTKATTFPAVLNGKVVGSLVAPVGAEANLVAIKDDKLGLEFNGGGAWLTAEETDLIARVQAPR